jgi:pimeloyl-ACP methyl ester carboxylesterase
MKNKQLKYLFLTKSIGFYVNSIGFFAPKKAAKIAFKIFCKPRKGILKLDQLPDILKTAQLEKVECENEYFQAYVWKGSAEIIMLAHGWESNASRWRKMLPFLIETGKTIVAIDAPAHGLSTGKEFNAPKYSRFIAELCKKYNPKILIGHSIGGFACIYYQYINQNPNLEKIILLGAPSDLDLMFLNYYKLIGMSPKVQNQFNILVETKIETKISDFNAKDFVKKIKSKGLIIHDYKDYVVSIKEGRKIQKNWENATIFETTDLGHGLNVKEVFSEIVDFINK